MIINVTYDQPLDQLPAGFTSAIDYVVQYFQSAFTSNVTVNIDVGYKTYNGGSRVIPDGIETDVNALNGNTNSRFYDYATLKNALSTHATSADDISAVNSLPDSDPLGSGAHYLVSAAQARALGLPAGTANGSIDAYAGFNDSPTPFTYDADNRAVPGTNDFIGIALREFAHALGWISVGGVGAQDSALDLFRYSAPGVPQTGNGGYFSIDGGTTGLRDFDTHGPAPEGWDNGTNGTANPAAYVPDAGNFLVFRGYENDFTLVDRRAMDVLGWDLSPTVNQEPVLGGLSATAAYTEFAAPVPLSPGAMVTDPDSTHLTSATVRILSRLGITIGGDGDVLSAVTAGTSISASYDAANELLTLSGSDTLAHYQQVLRSVTFESTSDHPTSFEPTRTVQWQLNDGAAFNNHSVQQTTTINITEVPGPVLGSVASTAAYTENGLPVTLSPNARVGDDKAVFLASATVHITGGTFPGDGDVLAATTAGTFISTSYDPANEVLTLSGLAPLEDYQQVLRTVTFQSTSHNPTNFDHDTTRTIEWQLQDDRSANNLSPVQTTVVNIADAQPVIQGGAGNDLLLAGSHPNTKYDGGAGLDTIDYSATTQGIVVDLSAPSDNATGPEIGTDQITNVESVVGGSGNDRIVGNPLANQLDGGPGADTLTGGAGADKFVFDAAALADARASTPTFDRITDYDQGNSGIFNAGEGDQIDLSALLASAYNHGSGQPVAALVHAVASGTAANLQIDPDGTANGANWVTIARLDGVHGGNDVNVVLDSSQPAGATITVQGMPGNDVTGDGTSDVLWRNDGGQVATWEMKDGHILAGHDFGLVGTSWQMAGIGDLTGDGTSDVLWRSGNGQVAMWEMKGGQNPVGRDFGIVPTNWQMAGIGDLTGDGTSDVLWRSSNGQVAVWEMKDGHILTGHDFGIVPTNWQMVGIGDATGDGTSDVFWRSSNGQLAMWEMKGGQTLAGHDFGIVPTNWQMAGIGDATGDGTSDVFWRSDSGQVAMWEMKNGQIVAGHDFGIVPTNWRMAGIADVTGDGTSDVLWRSDNGQVAMWEMKGGQILAGHDLGMAGSNWHIFNDHMLV